jgi:hypothetical protein
MLQFGKPDPHTAVDTKAERQVLARPGTINNELVRAFDHFIIAVPRNVPHHHLVALPDSLAANFDVFKRGAAHMCQWGLIADHLGHEAVDQLGVFAQLPVLVRIFAQGVDAAGHGVAGGVVAADDQQNEIAQEISRIHVAGRVAVRHHRQQVAFRRLIDPLLPEFAEIRRAFQQLGLPLIFGCDESIRTGNGGCDV